ncbi:glycerate kinase [Klenkia soli]|uniref:Glycerate kinase n=1 Tax=Klenkia soli TaxID=1052260 RepID=A0A1H0L6A1_9ACTN|nr:glycerate kinase [Klenkia soli]SDO63501.1 glycerate kinase [Klenkia soli]
MLPVVRIVIAPDKFKGTLDADGVAAAIAAGVARVHPAAELLLRPIADGGDGTVAAALRAGWTPLAVRVSGPDGAPREAVLAVDGDTALVELATAAGLHLAPPAPLTASTRGVGELLLAGLDAGVRRLVVGIGGSATTDAGTGMLAALGVRFLDASGAELPPGGAALARLDRIDATGLDPRLAGVPVLIATDVDAPLTGPTGAAHVFGPQKGATPAQVDELDTALARFAAVVRRDLGVEVDDVPGAGGAGGTAAGALALLGAEITSGADLVCDLVGLDAALAGADLVITGEGALDAQTLTGKGPAVVARRAAAAGVRCLGLAGVVLLAADDLAGAGFAGAHGLTDVEPDVAVCRAEPARLLADLAERVIS